MSLKTLLLVALFIAWVATGTVAVVRAGRPKRLDWFIARHYLRAGRGRVLLSLITWIAVGGVTLGVGALITVTSVISGMQGELRSKILESTPHLYVLEVGHARDLVAQILTFSRTTEIEKKVIKTIPIVKEVCKFIRSSLPTTIDIRQQISAKHDWIMADPTQFHQVLMNMCTNAGYAMKEKGGILEVALKEIVLDEIDLITSPDLKIGSYLKLTVKDTGHGIDQETLNRIFEPYFTTKEKGEGTGLGLAVVHGIVKDYGGDIQVYSEVDRGTTFQVLFPLVEKSTPAETLAKDEPLPTGTETILFVDDEEHLVNIGQQLLKRLGYQVVGMTNPKEALALFKSSKQDYDLIITDKTMPKMTGFELAREVNQIRPDIPILLCSGFKEKSDEEDCKNCGISQIIVKPIDKRLIAEAIRKLLDLAKRG